jgi:HEPN domain-containing protein
MNELVKEWLSKAAADANTAKRELAVEQEPNYDAVCFHAQQAVEKLFKGLLQQHRIAFPKTHDLGLLLEFLLRKHGDLQFLREDILRLTTFAVEFRYPGESAIREDAETAVASMDKIMQQVRQFFPQGL